VIGLFDTAGQEKFRAITHNYYKGTDGILLIYDIDDNILYHTSLHSSDFKGFEVYNFGTLKLDIPVDEISKIRIYPCYSYWLCIFFFHFIFLFKLLQK